MAFKIADGYVEIHGRLDENSVRRAAERTGNQAGDRFATAFSHSSSHRFRKLTKVMLKPINAMAAALAGVSATSGLAGVTSLLLGLVPSAGKATFAIGGALVPALFSLLSVVGITRLMLGKLDDEISRQTLKALTKMSKEIRQVALEAAKPGLNEFMEGVVKNGPLFERYIGMIAGAIGDALGGVGRLLGDAGFVSKLNSLFEQTAESTRIWTGLLDDLVEMLVTIGDAASPLFYKMMKGLEETVGRWKDWLNLKYETGELMVFFEEAGEELGKWARILTNVVVGLFNIFAAGVGPSGKLADSLERITEAFRKWTEQSENVDKVRKVFQFMVDHVDDFFRLAASALVLAGALKGIALAVSVIKWGRMVASLGPAGLIMGALGVAVAGVAAGFLLAYNHSESFREKLSELWTKIKEDLWPILQEWGTWIKEELAPELETFANETLQKIIDGFDQLVTKYNENREGIQALREAFAEMLPIVNFVVQNIVEELAGFVGQVVTVIGWVGRLIGWLNKIPVKTVTKYLFQPGAALAWIGRVTRLTKAIPKVWRTLYSFLGMASGVAAIRRIIGWIARIPRNVRTTFTSVTTNIVRSITQAINPFARASGGLIGAQGMATGGNSGARQVLVGEQGPELVDLPFGSRVRPAGQTRRDLAGAGDRQLVIRIESGGSRMDDLLVEILRGAIRGRGGNVQMVLGRGKA